MGADERRVYYDHEGAYRRIAAKGGKGWDDLGSNPGNDSYTALEAFLASPFAPPMGTRALDLGCGGGQATIRLATKGYVAVGVEYSETGVALARKNGQESGLAVSFERDDCLTLTTQKSGSFGLVLDNHVLHCIVTPADREAFFNQVKRVLVPGGIFFTETMSSEDGFDPAKFDVDPATGVSRNKSRIRVSEVGFDQELKAAGFETLHASRRTDPGDPPGCGSTLVRYLRRV